jgi:hypothetical protein
MISVMIFVLLVLDKYTISTFFAGAFADELPDKRQIAAVINKKMQGYFLW